MSKILIIEDEVAIADLEKDYLELSGFDVQIEYAGDKGLTRALKEDFDLIVLDLMMPRLDGLEACTKIREFSQVPIIMLTAKSTEYDKVVGLDSGADDYLAKPFNTEELLARIRALGRRRGEIVSNTNTISYGDITLNTSSLKLTAGASEITLTLKESELLEHLMLHKEMVCSKEQIIEKLWGFDSEAESNHVEVYISFLRKKLAFVHSKVSINTIRGVGYTLSE